MVSGDESLVKLFGQSQVCGSSFLGVGYAFWISRARESLNATVCAKLHGWLYGSVKLDYSTAGYQLFAAKAACDSYVMCLDYN